ncbi:MAG: hypothetical protein JO308_13610 [Verrucomicrobia bacterium]|nr:hypothetical protein [Verrucomicrobiota bacterium]
MKLPLSYWIGYTEAPPRLIKNRCPILCSNDAVQELQLATIIELERIVVRIARYDYLQVWLFHPSPC